MLLGLTGGIGMGKSTAEALLRERGIVTVDTDQLARELVQPGQPALGEIREAFGQGVIDANGCLCRRELARIVFADPVARRRLEGILHPRIRAGWLSRQEEWRSRGIALGVVVIPLLFETGAERDLDQVVCLACSSATQSQRLAARGWSALQIRQRLEAQMPVDQKISRSDFMVWTEGSLASHAAQLDRVLARLGA